MFNLASPAAGKLIFLVVIVITSVLNTWCPYLA